MTYTLNNANQLEIHYKTTDLSKNLNTVINLTNHSYFNLGGESSFPGSAYGQLIRINANRYTPTDTTQIPLGYAASVFGTPFDFTRPFAMGARIQDVSANFNSPGHNQLLIAQGYDHNWVLTQGPYGPLGLNLAARASSPSFRRSCSLPGCSGWQDGVSGAAGAYDLTAGAWRFSWKIWMSLSWVLVVSVSIRRALGLPRSAG